ncbi:MAG: hypothetical protein V8T45_09380 [Oscillospiraceae bacterium]
MCREGLDSGAILHWLGDLEAIHRWQEGYSAMVRRVAQSLGCRILDFRSVFPDSIEEQEKYRVPTGYIPTAWGSVSCMRRQCALSWRSTEGRKRFYKGCSLRRHPLFFP